MSDDNSGRPAGQDLPDSGFVFERSRAALVVIDPQNDFLSPGGAGWPVFGRGVTENNTVANLGRLFEAAESVEMTVAVSPHHDYPVDWEWRFAGPAEQLLSGPLAAHRTVLEPQLAQVSVGPADQRPRRYPQDGHDVVAVQVGPDRGQLLLGAQLGDPRLQAVVGAGQPRGLGLVPGRAVGPGQRVQPGQQRARVGDIPAHR